MERLIGSQIKEALELARAAGLVLLLGGLGSRGTWLSAAGARGEGVGERAASLQLLTGWGSFVGLPGPRVWCPNRAGAVAGTRELPRAYFGDGNAGDLRSFFVVLWEGKFVYESSADFSFVLISRGFGNDWW